ncbi:TonB-dependent receptor [Alteromonas oceanisediminis]|uniref:TonB-dependent receptor n=1 Tax=Alteromonas oceanisediminis TaxID=2836180 RepID=UPI001BDA34F8|nr:TonB-dependent receptor [Alteromonas oceanisediminis]MBT0585982.1 TonB-dependent receptor [Alteromonas oceanisediminis]
MKRTNLSLLVSAGLSTMAFSPTALANEQPTTGDNIEKVVVYGQKIERTLQDTKESVAVISEQFIDDIGLLDLDDAYLTTANVFSLDNGENFGIRGITQNASATGGGNGELGSFYMDGVAFTGFATRFGPRDLWDVKQVEVLRGPQSTNVGRQALIGAVVVETNDPDLSGFDAAVRGQVGNFGTYSGEGMINLAVGDDSALRLTAETFSSDGYIENELLDADYNPEDSHVFRAKYLYAPSDDFSVQLTLQYAKKEIGWDSYRFDLQPIDSYQDSANLLSEETYEGYSAAVDVQYDVNDTWSVRAVTSFISGEYSRFNDDDGGPEGGDAFRGRAVDDQNWAQEVRLSYTSDTVSGVMGVYYTEVDLDNDTTGIVALNPASLGVPNVLLPFYPETLVIDVLIPSETATTNLAFFTEWDWQLSERVTLSAGFRYDQEDQDVLTNARNSLAEGSFLPDPVASGELATQLGFDPATVAEIVGGITQVNGLLGNQLAQTDNPLQSTSFNAFLPQVGVTYDLTESSSVSAFYKRGYRAGGIDVDTVGSIDEYNAEYLDNVELAYRSLHLDGDLVFNANAYYGWWKDQQLTIFVNGSLFDTDTVNAGESTIYGLEMELQYRVSDDTKVYASFGLAETQFDEFCFVDGTSAQDITDATCDAGDGPGRNLEGADFAFSPDLTAAVGAKHFFDQHWYVGGNITHQGSSFSDIVNTAEFKNDSFTLVNLNVGYAKEDFEARVYVKNAFDEFYTNFQGPGIAGPDARLVRPGVPREFGIMLSQRF